MLKSLCFMRLRTAGVFIGWCGLMGSALIIIGLSVLLGYSDKIEEIFTMSGFLPIVCGIYLAFTVLNLLASGLLLFGIIKDRHWLLPPWLINTSIHIVFSFSFVVITSYYMFSSPFGYHFPNIVFWILVLVVKSYFFCGIYSLFKQMKVEHDQQCPVIHLQDVYVPQSAVCVNCSKV